MKVAHVDPAFWKGKKVFLTGHTGFKGGWLSLWLSSMGAKVTGYALAAITSPNLFDVLEIDSLVEKSHIANICDLATLQKAMSEANPDVVIHMAAQPLVRYSYVNPVETYATNVMGTVHVLEGARNIDTVQATVVVTTDKCYENNEWVWGYRENEPMGGHDPYSNSKGCAELVTSAYRQSYFSSPNSVNKVASARAGNVIGGGDWSQDRLIPDAIKAFELNKSLMIRNPRAIRPWQHVLEPLSGYLILAQALYEQGSAYATSWNFGPRDEENCSVQEMIELVIAQWGGSARWEKEGAGQPHEASLLKLDCSKARTQLGWIPRWDLEIAIQKIVQWQKAYQTKENMLEVSLAQINHYMSTK
ncbi:CDP-glucose 4,6-dehydratase [Polynucleobacter sp. JS-JIR-5-A7]|uniref:CDP-glucose 4,6-dehydratase n=1 Tax=Polynucleobacter sp. JS-JIR-5-A7 TaxID=1758395 RepID=UPI001BFDF801|nr:CDP-glucose 4,6-dehydratase [Polynucleobacter sp. JS-JIR-5-A7]QWE06928.1 CDP-glucose 4,6-dehydratase [Polynucleobacter sp. JS-JIR-5-A7]